MRADARRNRDRLLQAAVEVCLEVGGDPPLDAVARRAGLGIATLYRHFPDRQALRHAVAHHVLARTTAAAEAALAETAVDQDAVAETAAAGAGTGSGALRRYVHAAVDAGVGVLHLLHPLLEDPDWSADRERIGALLEAILAQERRAGSLRPGVDALDVVVATIRFSRPVPLVRSPEEGRRLAHRHLDLFVDGLQGDRPVGRPDG